MNRRAFLSSSLSAIGGASLLAPSASAGLRLLGGPKRTGERTLVLIQLDGGNDGLSTLVPFGDDAYFRYRRATGIDARTLHRVTDFVGLHPSLAKLARRFHAGQAGLIQGVGYPGHNRSHFKSREIWHTADLRGRAGGNGWLGELCDHVWAESTLPELSVHIGENPPYSLYSPVHPPVVFNSPESYRWMGDPEAAKVLDAGGDRRSSSILQRLRGVMSDAQSSSKRILQAVSEYKTEVEYPGHSQSLRSTAALIDAGLGSRVLSVTIGGYDTHAGQRAVHSDLLRMLDDALDAFLRDISRCEAGRNTLVLVFSEFGRRVKENGSGGTDHGKAGLMFALGDPVKGGIYGEYPSLSDLDDDDLRFNVDFRRTYSTAIQWMGGQPEQILGQTFEPLPFTA